MISPLAQSFRQARQASRYNVVTCIWTTDIYRAPLGGNMDRGRELKENGKNTRPGGWRKQEKADWGTLLINKKGGGGTEELGSFRT